MPPRPKRRSTDKPRSSSSWAMTSPRMYDSLKFLEPTTTAWSWRSHRHAAAVAASKTAKTTAIARMVAPCSAFQLRLEKCPHELVGRVLQHLGARAVLHRAAVLQHDQALGQLQRLAQVMRHQDHRPRRRLLQAQELAVDLRP